MSSKKALTDNVFRFRELVDMYLFVSKLNKGPMSIKWLYSGISYFRSFEYPLVLSLLKMKKNMVLLDIGSGNGLFPFFVAFRGYKIYATDLEVVPLRQTLDNIEEKFLHVDTHVERQDATNLTYKRKLFDRITAISALEHLKGQNDIKAMEELARVLRKKGKLIMTLPFGKKMEGEYDGVFLRRYDDDSIKKRIVGPSGLVVKKTIYFGQRIAMYKIFSKLSYEWRKRLSLLQMFGSLISLHATENREKADGICLVFEK